ncbi:Holliday junction resolvase RuvX [Helicobacter sp. MIT 05-5293]|uniref:Holliday junction resolvase RuvX n=1 Tax=Helicobacter sp. MIT 05-5293 TaxID=1548149 RepID=UPI00068F0B49|nr:Holliday junction resolvase RuvX [Helicobacter sp. MIT 05-5293]TLD80834.1 Holliday junction resolvase RuvX [Helicobacter sp. MIT 05-5293]
MTLACDVGIKKIGLAAFVEGIVLPLDPILRQNRNQAAKELASVLYSRHITHLVVGLPSNDQATHEAHEMEKRIKHFIDLLEFQGEIIYINEDYTSIEAFRDTLHMKKQSRAKAQKDGKIDSLSACIILERYIESYNN